jgi:teichuronic acid biosynthesis glycosyltransferase TuaC
LKILTFSSLYPNAVKPSHGIFVEHRLRQLLGYAPQIEARVIAPVPWFPLNAGVFGEYAAYAQVAASEMRHGIAVQHPRYPVIPKVGMQLTPWLMYRALRAPLKRLQATFDFDLIDAHYFYPDGVAAMYLARELGKPFVVTGRGTDLNLIPRYAGPRRRLQLVVKESAHMITVAAALKDYLLELGAEDERVTVLRNGVDLTLFHPEPEREALRRELSIEGPTLLSVGHLIERKGHHLAIEAMAELPQWQLLVIGDGPMDKALRQQADAAGVADRVRFVGRVDQPQLRAYYAAGDALVLASSREGWANVLLEAMACGTPVVASPVDGTPEVVADAAAGVLMNDLSAASVVDGVRRLSQAMPQRSATRAYAEGFDWDQTSQGQLDVFERVLA